MSGARSLWAFEHGPLCAAAAFQALEVFRFAGTTEGHLSKSRLTPTCLRAAPFRQRFPNPAGRDWGQGPPLHPHERFLALLVPAIGEPAFVVPAINVVDRCITCHPGVDDPLTDADVLAEAVRRGILDAPHLRSNKFARGEIRTAFLNGACVTVDAHGREIKEKDRLNTLLQQKESGT